VRNPRSARLGICALATLAVAGHPSGQLRDAPIPHASGQSVTPSFEGWYPNADGSFSLSFGYMNRNYKEELDIPVGMNNRFEPGPPDRGQPTHFLPRRHTGVFVVVVPKDFGDRKLTWTLTAHGQTISIPGHLRPEWQIDALKDIASGNTPAVVRFEQSGPAGQGPGGTTGSATVTLPSTATLTAWVTDDRVRKRGQGGGEQRQRGPDLGVVWSPYRGPGKVTFSEVAPKIDQTTGKTTTTASFSAPGDYVLRLLAWDSSGGPANGIMAVGFQCCWTNGYMRVTVR
jgi:hypothetical protein